jgi:L,D-transpeptidase catalytic domain
MRIAILAASAVLFTLGSVQAEVSIHVDKTAQRLSVSIDGKPLYDWPVSTARWGYNTPNGTYHPERLEKSWYSRKYDMSPMPHSIFFDGGYAIHGSYEVSRLGRPASHGCIRLSPSHAATLFALVKEHRSDTNIVVTGSRPAEPLLARAERREAVQDSAAASPYPQQRNFQNYFNWSQPRQGGWYEPGTGRWWRY